MNRFRNILKIAVLIAISLVMVTSCDNQIKPGLYVPDNIWSVGGMTYYKFSDAMAALEAENSKAIDARNVITLLRDVGESERGEGLVIPASYTGEVEINLGGYEYWFKDDLDYFLEVRGGKAVNIVNGTTVISEDGNIIPKALVVNTEVVKLENQKIDDRRPHPQAIQILSAGILEISTGAELTGDISVSGGGQLGVKGGAITSSKVTVEASSDNTRVSKIDIESGTLTADTISANSEDSDESKAAVINVSGGTVGVKTLEAKSNSTITVKESNSSVKTEVTIGSLTTQGSDSSAKARIEVSSGTLNVETLDAKSNSNISIKETDADATTSVTIGTISAEGDNSNSKAVIEVTSGTVTVTDSLSAKKNSEVKITKETSTEEEKKAVVTINAITSEGTDDTATSTEAAKIDISAGKISVTELTTKDGSSVNITSANTSGDDDVSMNIEHTQTDDSSKVTVDGGDVVFEKTVKTNTTENSGTMEIKAGTIKTTETDMVSVKDSRTEGSTAVIFEYHKVKEHHAYTAATCTEAGNREYWECEYCNYLFSSADLNEEDKIGLGTDSSVIESLTIAALGHNAASVWSTDGTGHWHECNNGCGVKLDYEDHTADENTWKTTNPDGHYHVCAICGAGQLGLEAHNFGDWVDTGVFRTRVCSICQRTEVADHVHSMQASEAVEATCEEAGQRAYWYCEGCEKYFLDSEGVTETTLADTVVPALGHKTTHVPALAATCTKAGNYEYWYCSRCGKYFSDQACTQELTKEGTVIAATGHNFSTAWTHDSRDHWHVCQNEGCSVVSGSSMHTFGSWSFDSEKNERTRTCSVCGYVQRESHSNHVLTKTDSVAETCTTDGNKDYWTCSICGGIFLDENGEQSTTADGVVIKAHHVLSTHVEYLDPGCTEVGNVEYWQCKECGKYFLDSEANEETTLADTVIAATGHSTSLEYKAFVDATCTEEGNNEYWYCPDCERYYSDAACTTEIDPVIAAKGHTYPTTYQMDKDKHWQICTVCGAESTHTAHTEQTVAYSAGTTAQGTHITVTWGCAVCGYQSGTPTPTLPSTGSFELVETHNGVVATKNGDGDWTLTLDSSVVEGCGGVVAKSVWKDGNNNVLESGKSSIDVTIGTGVSRVVFFVHYLNQNNKLVGGGYAILPGKTSTTGGN